MHAGLNLWRRTIAELLRRLALAQRLSARPLLVRSTRGPDSHLQAVNSLRPLSPNAPKGVGDSQQRSSVCSNGLGSIGKKRGHARQC
jgi:hypothetical protein